MTDREPVVRTSSAGSLLRDLLHDLRFGLRTLARKPAMTTVALVSLALGIGANTLIFSLVHGIFFEPLAVRDVDRLVMMHRTFNPDASLDGATRFISTSFLNYEDLDREVDAFDGGLAAWTDVPVSVADAASTDPRPEQMQAQMATGNFFQVLGVDPAQGRLLEPADDTAGDPQPVVVLSYGLWQRRWGGDPGVVGSSLRINGQVFTIVGVVGERFRGTSPLVSPELWIPARNWTSLFTGQLAAGMVHRGYRFWSVTGRMKDGVTMAAAQQALEASAVRLEERFPAHNRDRGIALEPLAQATIFPGLRDVFVLAGALLMGSVGLVLLVACVNVANLLLAHAASRSRELSVRLSLGAGGGRLVRQLLTESLLLSFLGGLAGWLLAVVGRDALWRLRPPFLDRAGFPLRIDGEVLLFTLGVVATTGLLFGLAPALRAARTDVVRGLGRVAAVPTGVSRLFGRRTLLAIQTALCVVVLAVAALFVQSLGNAFDIDPGFAQDGVAFVQFDAAARSSDDAATHAFLDMALQEARSLPGVQAAALTRRPPLGGGGAIRLFPEGVDDPALVEGAYVAENLASTDYFELLEIPVLAGRPFTEQDRRADPETETAGGRPVMVVNRALVERFWPPTDGDVAGAVRTAVGKRIRFDGTWHEVVGVVENVKVQSVGEEPLPHVYRSAYQVVPWPATLLLRTEGAASALLPQARQLVRRLDPEMPVIEASAVSDQLERSLWAPQAAVSLLGTFGLLGLVLAAVGVYGVVAQAVLDRRREVGIRMALGAARGSLLALVVRQGMTPVLAGVALGAVAAVVVTRRFADLLFGLDGAGVSTLAAAGGAMLVVAFLASWLPGRRATKIDPMVTLRSE